jgi:CRP-like cAMP-binding protein
MIEARELQVHLPYSLLREIMYITQKDILIPMFKDFKSENLIKELSYVLQNTIYMPGDYIILKDQMGEEMYFIIEGTVQVIAGDKSTVLTTLTTGNYFGEVAIFMRSKRIAYVQAKTFCIMSILKKQDIEQIILSFPSLASEFEEIAKTRMMQAKAMAQQ